MHRPVITCLLLLLLAGSTSLGQGIVDGFAADVPVRDTSRSISLPSASDEIAGARGFVTTTSDGRFAFEDGAPARFVGVTLEWSACMPDSAQAITMAARMAKLGINLVRMRYFENAYAWGSWASVLDPRTGYQSLDSANMRRFDWLVYQLREHGIYTYLTLQSARAPVAADGYGELADSSLWLGVGLYHLYPQGHTALRKHARLLLDHVNPFTGRAYRDEPAIAMIELLGTGSLTMHYKVGYTHHVNGGNSFSFDHSRRLDTMFATYLGNRYGDRAGLEAAWRVTPPAGGFPNLVSEGSFEGAFDQHWTAVGYDGTSVTPILTQNDSVPDGQYAMTLRVRGARGVTTTAYLTQSVPLEYNTLYRLSFRAKASNPEGRSVYLVGVESVEGTYAGLSTFVDVTSSWKQHEVLFVSPAVQKAPVSIYMFFGDVDGDLSIDAVELKAVQPVGLQPQEALANATVARIPYGHESSLLVASKRIEDQAEFYMSIDRELLGGLRRFIRDTVRARQPITGASHNWATNLMEASVERTMDFTTANAAWDYVEGLPQGLRVRNTSPLRAGYAGVIYDNTGVAHDRQPFVAAIAHPFPNRYLAESMLLLPAYAMHQQWDAVIFDTWTDDRSFDTLASITPSKFNELAKNPVANALLPAVSQMFRRAMLSEAETTIRLQHTRRQIQQIPRFAWSLNRHALPTHIPLWSMAVSRIVHDSLDATEFSQANDISFPPALDDEAMSDTREIRWEFAQGVLSINTPRVQAATGHLGRSGGVSLDKLDIEVLSNNETATVAWVAIDSTRTLDAVGRSLLVVTSRTEPTAMAWVDTNIVTSWGRAPMLVDPVRVRLRFDVESPATRLAVMVMDSAGHAVGTPLPVSPDGSVLIDQRVTRSQWYEVVVDPSSGVGDDGDARGAALLAHASASGHSVVLQIAVTRPVSDARVELFDALGRRAAMLIVGDLIAGSTRRTIDARGLASGTYTAVLRAGDESATTRIAIVR